MADALDFSSELEDLIQDYLWWGIEGSRENNQVELVTQRRIEIIKVMKDRLVQLEGS